mmetsp:Transcript_3910/g.6029  ORF Transcript_3910/g.6029 Transcript_3910/m.6029 type:complete len:115 (-) Transcript_3910:99-443(-)
MRRALLACAAAAALPWDPTEAEDWCPAPAVARAVTGISLIQLRGTRTVKKNGVEEEDKLSEVVESDEVRKLVEASQAKQHEADDAIRQLAGYMHSVGQAMHDSPCAFSARGCET